MLGDVGRAYETVRPGEIGPADGSCDLMGEAGLNPSRGLMSATALPFGCCFSSSGFLNFQKSLFRCLAVGSLSGCDEDWSCGVGWEEFFNKGAAESLDSVEGVFVLGWMALMEGSLEDMVDDPAQSMSCGVGWVRARVMEDSIGQRIGRDDQNSQHVFVVLVTERVYVSIARTALEGCCTSNRGLGRKRQAT